MGNCNKVVGSARISFDMEQYFQGDCIVVVHLLQYRGHWGLAGDGWKLGRIETADVVVHVAKIIRSFQGTDELHHTNVQETYEVL